MRRAQKKCSRRKTYFIQFMQIFSFLIFSSSSYTVVEPEKKGSSESSIITSNTTSDGVFEGRQAGSYIKGDPLNGYYDFIITEGSYKFWVVFQVTSIIKWKIV